MPILEPYSIDTAHNPEWVYADRVANELRLAGDHAHVRVRQALAQAYLDGAAGAQGKTSKVTKPTKVHIHLAKSSKAPSSADEDDLWAELRGWWEQTAHDEIDGLISKMIEYGGLNRATDLMEVGQSMVAVGVSEGPLLASGAVQDGWLQELGGYFYLRGKFARWTAAIKEGRPVSDDTLHDIAIYVRMVQRIRARGGWPV